MSYVETTSTTLAAVSEAGRLSLCTVDDGTFSLRGQATAPFSDGLGWLDGHVMAGGRTFDMDANRCDTLPSPGNSQLIRLGADSTLYLARGRELHALKQGATIPQLLQRHHAPIIALAVCEDRLAAVSWDGPVMVNELPSVGARTPTIATHGKITTLTFSRPRLGLLACGDSHGIIHILQPARLLSVVKTLDMLKGRALQGLAFSTIRPTILYAVTKRGTIVELDVERKIIVSKVRLNVLVHSIDLATDGRWLALGTSTGSVMLQDLLDLSKPARELGCDQGSSIAHVAFHPTSLPPDASPPSPDHARHPSRSLASTPLPPPSHPSPTKRAPESPSLQRSASHNPAALPHALPKSATLPDITVLSLSPSSIATNASNVCSSATEGGTSQRATQPRTLSKQYRRRSTSSMQTSVTTPTTEMSIFLSSGGSSGSHETPLSSAALSARYPFFASEDASSGPRSQTSEETIRPNSDVMGELRRLRTEMLKQAWLTRSELREAIESTTEGELRRLRAENAALKAEVAMLREGKR